ncbi:hypothetical protein B0H11DRAFT_2187806 [Mycena galericulata]|nr:hypothetical protein B0H11DRAFT_2187806 [Mycena galericulata]
MFKYRHGYVISEGSTQGVYDLECEVGSKEHWELNAIVAEGKERQSRVERKHSGGIGIIGGLLVFHGGSVTRVVELFQRVKEHQDMSATPYQARQSDIDRRHLKGAELAIFEGLGKRFKAFTPKVLSQQLRDDHSAFVNLELELFPNTSTNLKLAAVDNYVPIFEDILEVDMDERVSEAYDVLSARACHVLCGLILQRHNFELRSMDCPDMFDSANVEELAAVITELCVSLCIDENRQEFSTVLKRLKVKDLQEIGKKHGMKVLVIQLFGPC